MILKFFLLSIVFTVFGHFFHGSGSGLRNKSLIQIRIKRPGSETLVRDLKLHDYLLNRINSVIETETYGFFEIKRSVFSQLKINAFFIKNGNWRFYIKFFPGFISFLPDPDPYQNSVWIHIRSKLVNDLGSESNDADPQDWQGVNGWWW